MFDFGLGATELLLIAVVAIIVVGPKDLPRLLRTIGQMTSKVRAMAREFQGHLEDAAKETGLDEVRSDISKMTDLNVTDLDDPVSDLKSAIEDAAPASDKDMEQASQKEPHVGGAATDATAAPTEKDKKKSETKSATSSRGKPKSKKAAKPKDKAAKAAAGQGGEASVADG